MAYLIEDLNSKIPENKSLKFLLHIEKGDVFRIHKP